jgi:hypothetical protein
MLYAVYSKTENKTTSAPTLEACCIRPSFGVYVGKGGNESLLKRIKEKGNRTRSGTNKIPIIGPKGVFQKS